MLNTDWAQVEVIDLINDGSGLAFGIIGGRSTGVVVKTIVPGGVADRDGRLQSGDHILQIGEVNLRGLGSEQVASVLRQCGVHVRMVVARPVESTSTDYRGFGSHAPIVPTKILSDPVELDKHLLDNGYGDFFLQNPSNSYTSSNIYNTQRKDVHLNTISGLIDVVRNPLPIGVVPSLPPESLPPVTTVNLLPLDMALRESSTLPETEIFTVTLKKDELGLGITVAGYVCEKEEISGIFVKSISKGSAADLTKRIKINDRIIEVNGKSVLGYSNHQAVEILRNSGNSVKITVERYLRGPKYEQLQQAILANEYRPASPPSPSASSLPKIPLSLVHLSSLGIEPEGESRTSLDFDSGLLQDFDEPFKSDVIIDTLEGRKSVQFSICSHESIYDKWRDKFGQDADIVIAEMTKEYNIGLGISLEGTVDVEDGKEVRPHHYIRNILPNGPVGMNGTLRSGDELLEVNGIQLLGLNHLEVVSILKQLPSLVKLVCARYSVPTRIIDTAQHKDAFEARNILAESISNLMKSSDKLVKAKSDTSITSSIVSETCCSAGSRSRSLEIVAGLPMWCTEVTFVELMKGDHGLGFSILDYQDPLNPHKTVIVIRSLIPGGIAQQDGRLIPGDRLLSVNDINVEHATLDQAVQVLKGTPKGLVKIGVAKPLSVHDASSRHSQDTEDDQTCIDDFQECIEEYQECLEVVQICIEEERTFNRSPCLSQDENSFHLLKNNNKDAEAVFFLNDVNNKYIDDSEPELSFTSICDINSTKLDNILENNRIYPRTLLKTDSLQSDKNNFKSVDDSEKDGYETCLDESFSDDITSKMPRVPNEINPEHKKVFLSGVSFNSFNVNANDIKEEIELSTVKTANKSDDVESEINLPENFNKRILEQSEDTDVKETEFCDKINEDVSAKLNSIKEEEAINFTKTDFSKTSSKNFANSEPCLNTEVFQFSKRNQFCGNISIDDGLNSYDNAKNINAFKEDEFFLIQYPDDLAEKCHSEPNVLEKLNGQSCTYRYKIEEYYNDIEDCLQSFREEQSKVGLEKKVDVPEISDDDIFDEILVPTRSKSAPEILDNSFVTLTYDPGPSNTLRRKSSFLPGECIERDFSMTVSKPIENSATISESIEVDKMLQKHWAPPKTVVIRREPNMSLGISIVGGKVDLYEESKSETVLGIFIKNVVPNSPAGRCGELKTGDRILEVGGISLRNMSHEKAVETIKYAKNPISFLIQSLIPHSNCEQSNSGLGQFNCTSPFPSPVNSTAPVNFGGSQVTKKPTLGTQKSVDFSEDVSVKSIGTRNQKAVESSEDSDDEEDVRDYEGRTVTAKGQEIDRASAGNIKRSKEEVAMDPEEEDDFGYTMNKVKKKYANLGHSILMVQLERAMGQGLGLSLAGHKDRNCMAVFVCGINPKGAAYKAGGMQVGDEILEVNGVVLHGRCHLNASAIIKGLSGPIFKVIILRRKAAIDDIAVRPITQFPVSLAEEASEESFSNYPNVRTVAIKKGNQSLGIMIIEGKHAEVGQGIFISDIQEGSSAEKAGLEIGEMILAVNKDSLLGSNYDSAANLLKRSEGLVTLVVSNPGKKTSTPLDDKNASTGLKAGSAASRPTTPTPEPPADPTVCAITPGKDTTIEIASDNKPLGVWFIGGKDTSVPGGIIIVEIYPGGAADKDGRLQPGDQILDVNGTSLKDVSYNTALQALRQTLPKIKLVIYRSETPEFQKIDADFVKKPGKGLGLSITARKSGKGVYVTEILNGGSADIDGKIIRGDLLISINGQSIDSCTSEEAAAALKLVTGKVSLKLNRFKPTTR